MERGRRHLKGKKKSRASGKGSVRSTKNSPRKASRKPSNAPRKQLKARKDEPQVQQLKNTPERGKNAPKAIVQKKRPPVMGAKVPAAKIAARKAQPKRESAGSASLAKSVFSTFLGRSAKKEDSGRKEARKKQRGRLARSIENRSRLAVFFVLLVVIGLIAVLSIYQKGETDRLIEDLKLFSVPKRADDFLPGSEPCVNAIIARGEETVAPLLAKYSEMNSEQKAACVYVLGELLKKTQDQKRESLREPLRAAAIDILKKAVLDYDPSRGKNRIIREFAIRSAAKMGESAIEPFLRELQKRTPSQQDDLLEAVARTQTNVAESKLLKLSREGSDVFREIVAGKLVYYENSSNVIQRIFEMAQDIDYPKAADRALLDLEKLLEKEKLENDINTLAKKIKNRFNKKLRESSKSVDIDMRARLLALMGVLGAVENLSGKNASLFKKYLREYLRKSSPKEIAAAAYGLGVSNDVDYVREIMNRLDHPDQKVTAKVMESIIRLENPETLNFLFAMRKDLAQNKKQHVLKAVAEILQKFYLHAVQDEYTGTAIGLLAEISQNANDDTGLVIAKTLRLYLSDEETLEALWENEKYFSACKNSSIAIAVANILEKYSVRAEAKEMEKARLLLTAIGKNVADENSKKAIAKALALYKKEKIATKNTEGSK